MRMIQKFLSNESGASAVEYGLLLALISTVGVVAMTAVGTSLVTIFTNAGTSLAGAITP